MELAIDGEGNGDDEVPECRIILSVCLTCPPALRSISLTYTTQIDVRVDNHHLLDRIEWDLRSGLTPVYSPTLPRPRTRGRGWPLIAHAIHEELMRHKMRLSRGYWWVPNRAGCDDGR